MHSAFARANGSGCEGVEQAQEVGKSCTRVTSQTVFHRNKNIMLRTFYSIQKLMAAE